MNTLKIKSILATLIMVLASGSAWAEEVIVGRGTYTTSSLPMYGYGNYTSTTECIYTPDELKTSGVITSIAYNAASIGNTYPMPIEIYMRYRESSTYSSSSNYAPPSSLTLVYSGDISFKTGWNVIELTTPFAYNGSDNLEVVVCKKSPNNYNWSDNYFYYTSYDKYQTLYRYSSNSYYGDISNTSSFSRSSSKPNTKFEIFKSYTSNGIQYGYDTNGAIVINALSLSGNVTIPSSIQPGDGKTYNVVGIGGYAFKNCAATSITIPNTITSIGNNAFEGCTGLTSFSIPTTITTLGTSIFEGCTNLRTITIPASMTKIPDGLFKGCTGLTSYSIPTTVTALGIGVFEGCVNLKSVTFSASTPISLDAQNSLPYNAALYVPSSAVAAYKAADKWSDHKDQIWAVGTKTEYDLTGKNAVTADAGMSVLHAKIGEEHLAEVVSLKVEGTINSYDLMVMRNKMVGLINLDLSEATIIANSYEYYTGYCSVDNTLTRWALNDNLYSVKLPKTLKKINSYALQNLKNLTELEIPASVTEIAYGAAYNMKNLKTLKFADNSQCATISSEAFSYCQNLTSMTFGKNIQCTTIGTRAFYGCSLNEVCIPSSVTNIERAAFANCPISSLTFEDGEKVLSLSDGITDEWNMDPGYNEYSYLYINGHYYSSNTPFGGCPIKNLYLGRKFSYSDSNVNIEYWDGWSPMYYDTSCATRLCTEKTSLKSVEFGEYASAIDAGMFAGCTNLEEVKGLENIKSIGEGAFYQCSKLESLTIPSSVTSIEPWAFYSSGLKSMNIPAGVKTLGEYAFGECRNLETFTFSDDCEITAIPDYFLYNATKLDNIALPKNTLTIGNYAFYGCTLMQECKISSKITKIGDYAFNQCNNLNSVYAYTFEPQAIDQNTFSTYHTATLHIPSASYLLYFYDTQWSQFLHLVGFDSEAEQIGINVDYHLYTETNGIIGGKPRVDIQGKGGLTVIGDKVQPFGDIHITASDKIFGSLVASGNVTADKIYFDINVNKDKWYFFCFPFDISLTNIKKDGSFKWAIYDGEARANNGASGWKELPASTKKLLKGKGYIFRTNFEGELSLRVDNPTFEAVDEQTTLTSYVSQNEANANWNMVGNPYPCYYPINKLQYGAPIIVWNGTGYDAYRPGDDDYILHPFEAIFVQKPQSVSSIGFLAEWRQTYTGSHPVANNAKTFGYEYEQAENSRRFVNLTLSHGDFSDKTRVVLNEAQSIKYEQECDAAKFESTEQPQIYTLNADGTKFAINERPMENGRIALGFYAPEEGMYTFSATRMDVKAYIYDSMTSATYDLSEGEFTFNAEQGTDNTRFTLIFADEATGINGLPASYAGADKIYDLGGRKMNDAKTGVVIKNGKKVTMK